MTSAQFLRLPAQELEKSLKSVAKKANKDQRSLMKRYEKGLKGKKK